MAGEKTAAVAYSVPTVARMLDMSTRTVHDMIRRGVLCACRINTGRSRATIRIPASEVDRILANPAAPATPRTRFNDRVELLPASRVFADY